MRKTRLLALIGLVLATALTACGGGGGDAFQSPSTGGSGTSSTANAVVALTLTASSQSVPVDGSGSATITATALNAANATVSGVAVNFSVTTGALVTVTQGTTDINGTAIATVKANGATAGATITVTAATGSVTGTLPLVAASASQTVTVTASSPTLLSNDSAPVTITALVRSSSMQAISGAPVTFSASSGSITPASVLTGANGVATAVLATPGDASARDIVVTASTPTASGSATVLVYGTTITLNGPSTLVQNGSAASYGVALLDSGGGAVANQLVTLASSAGNTVTPSSQRTNASGQAIFQVVATRATSPDTLTVSGAGVSARQKVNISTQSFSFTAPVANATVNVNAPTSLQIVWLNSGVPVVGQAVSFATTRGMFGASATTTATTDATGTATVSFSSPTAGPALVTASGSTANGAVSAQLPVNVVATTPASLVLQASPATIAPNGTSTITATVTDSAGNAVANQSVVFNVTDVTGGSLAPGSVVTNASGVAQTVYTATMTPSAYQGVVVTASIPGTAVSAASPAKLTVGGKTVYLSLGTGTVLAENASKTQFLLPYTVMAVDAAGNPVAGAQVTLQVQSNSLRFRKGSWIAGTAWTQSVSATCSSGAPNLDPGSVASVSPAIVTTDATGSANFNVVYPEDHALWVEARLIASASVQGAQSSSSASFWLPQLTDYLTTLTRSPPGLDSPYGTGTDCTKTN